jgi:hypothetical protein
VAIHPVFRELGPTAALVHETLTEVPSPRRDITRAAALPPRTVDEALQVLAEHGLARRDPHTGWCRGELTPDRIAPSLGVDLVHQELVARYRSQRVAWRDLLDRLGRRIRIPGRRVPNSPAPITWPAALSAPPPADGVELAYDRTLAGPPDDALAVAIALLRRELGATALPAGHDRRGGPGGGQESF